MKHLKIYSLFKTVIPTEIDGLISFIKTSEKKNGRTYQPLVKYIMKFYPDFRSDKLTLEALYHTLYPGKNFRNRVIISRLSELNKITEDFLINKSLEKDLFVRKYLLLEELRSRKQLGMFNRSIDKILNELKLATKLSHKRLYETNQFLILKGKEIYELSDDSNLASHINQNMDVFTSYAISYILSLTNEVINKEYFNKTDPEFKIFNILSENINFENIVEHIKSKNPQYSVYMELCYLSYMFNVNFPNDKHYYEFIELFNRNIENFDQYTRFQLFTYLYSYCIRNINAGKHEFKRDLYSLLKDIIKYKAYSPNEVSYMPEPLFRELVNRGIEAEDYDGLDRFIYSSRNLIKPDNYIYLKNYSRGMAEFHKNNYSECIYFLSKARSEYSLIQIDIRKTLLKSYYELNMPEEASSLIDNNKRYIKTGKAMQDDQKIILQNLNNAFIILFKCKEYTIKKEIQSVKTVFKENLKLEEKAWFMKKLNELLKK